METPEEKVGCAGNGGRNNAGLIVGVLILTAGVVLLLDRFGVIDAAQLWRYWPLALVAVGAAKVAQPQGPGRAFGIVLLVAGIVLSIDAFGFVHVDIGELIVPVALIGFGGYLLLRALEPALPRSERRRWRDTKAAPMPQIHEWSIFGGGKRKIASEFRGGDVMAFFGGWNIDLTQAEVSEEEAVIEANCMFGGIVIRVPGTWDVRVRGVGIFGGYGDRTRHPRPDEVPNPKRLVVRGVAMFGGVEVKN